MFKTIQQKKRKKKEKKSGVITYREPQPKSTSIATPIMLRIVFIERIETIITATAKAGHVTVADTSSTKL